MPFQRGEKYQSSLRVGKDDRGLQIGWTIWKTDSGGSIVPAEPDEIETEIGIKYGDPHDTLQGLKCTAIDIQRRDDCEIFDAMYDFTVPDASEPPDDFDEFMQASSVDEAENPFGPKRSGSGMAIEEYWWEDFDKRPFFNSADEPLESIPALNINVQVVRVTFNARRPVNTAAQGRATGRLLLAHLSYDSAEHFNRTTGVRRIYYANTYEVWKHPYRDWAFTKALDVGYRQKVVSENPNAPPRYVEIRDPESKEYATRPFPLDGHGKRVNFGPPAPLTFRVREVGDLGLPFPVEF